MTHRMTDEELTATARIAEGRILKVVVSWLFGIATIVIGAFSFMGWQTVSSRVNQLVDESVMEQMDSEILAELVRAKADSLVNEQIAQRRVDSLVARRVKEAEAKLIAPRSYGQKDELVLSVNDPTQVRVNDSSDSTVVLSIALSRSGEYEITAEALDDSMFDPVIAVVTRGDDQQAVLVDLDDDSGEGLNSLLRIRLEQEIDYELWVAGFLSAEPGTVTLTLREVEPDT